MNPNKRKGSQAETDVCHYLLTNGFPHAERRALHGSLDRGDVRANQRVTVEVKAYAEYPSDGQLQKWFAETRAEVRNAHASVGLLVLKRPRKPVGAWWAWRQDQYGVWVQTWLCDAVKQLHWEGWTDA